MLHLHCLAWLKEMSRFSDLCKKIASEDEFKIQLLSFLDQVIKCELTPIDTNQVLTEVGPSTLPTNDASVFASQFNNNGNFVISQVQMHFWTYNAICFKYACNKTQLQYIFHVLWFLIHTLKIQGLSLSKGIMCGSTHGNLSSLLSYNSTTT